jgi:arylsulfatase A-like enzyme
MTGQFAHNHGVLDNPQAANLDHDATFQKALHDAGYRTAVVGKFLNQWELSQDPPNFDRWSIWSNLLNGVKFGNKGYYNGIWNVQGTIREVEGYSTRFVAKRAVKFLEESETEDDKPWLLLVTPYAPHPEVTPEPKYADAPVRRWLGNPAAHEEDLSDKPPAWRNRRLTVRAGARIRRAQFRALMSVDDLVERIANKLAALNEGRQTLAFFTTDNGFLWSEHGRKGKEAPYEPSVRVPLFLRWPGHVPAGGRDRRLVELVDLAPTMLAATGVASGGMAIDGRSLLDLSWDRDRVLLEFLASRSGGRGGWASTWTRQFQYTEYYDEVGEISFREFYDRKSDPWQLENLYADTDVTNDPSPELTALLSQRLTDDLACAGSACP